MFAIEDFPNALFEPKNSALLTGILRGIEREALRTSMDGELSQKPHPEGLGSALTHPQITTDFSESLLEFITPPTHRVEDLFQHLHAIHNYTQKQLDNEMLWCNSMPCALKEDKDIPVALYGNSNNGKMKTIYRVGLGHRYGRAMQTVAGIHYNFSLPDAFWALLSTQDNSISDLQDFKNQQYFGLIRNFRRHYWLLIYLFGASPALCASFIGDKGHNLSPLGDGHSLYSPHATSLRMGDLGYQSKTQESLYVCYNQVSSYIKSLCCAITRPFEGYEDIGIKDEHGNYQQLNTSVLQIENEFYSAIRPKRTAQPGETALSALRNRGVEYIEVRCLDINPFSTVGITEEQVRFLDTFLLYCTLQSSPETGPSESALILQNQKLVVNQGRDPELSLHHHKHGEIKLRHWADELLKAMAPVAELLDKAKDTDSHSKALARQAEKVEDSSRTPSEQILALLIEKEIDFPDLAKSMSKEHFNTINDIPFSEDQLHRMESMAIESAAEQRALEERSQEDFDSFLDAYYKQYQKCSAS